MNRQTGQVVVFHFHSQNGINYALTKHGYVVAETTGGLCNACHCTGLIQAGREMKSVAMVTVPKIASSVPVNLRYPSRQVQVRIIMLGINC